MSQVAGQLLAGSRLFFPTAGVRLFAVCFTAEAIDR